MNITQFEKYVSGCLTTWNHGELDHELVNLTLGLAGEFIEFNHTLWREARDKQIDEAGDLLYYSTVLLYKINQYKLDRLDVDHVMTILQVTADGMNEAYLFPDFYPFLVTSFSEHDKFNATLQYVGFIVEHMKKHIFHGRRLDDDLISESVLQILMWFYYILNLNNIELQDVMNYNFDKLSKRYPEKFKKLG